MSEQNLNVKVLEMLRAILGALIVLSSVIGPAQATLISKDTIDIFSIQDAEGDTVCSPCGLSSVSYTDDPINSYSFDWWGSAGLAHDAYNQALADGVDIYDEGADNPLDENEWLNLHPNGIVFFNGEGLDDIFRVDVYWDGDLLDVYRDFIDVSYFGDMGMWYTSGVLDEGYQAVFSMVSDPPSSPIPEPGTFAIFVLGVIGAGVVSRRNIGGQPSA